MSWCKKDGDKVEMGDPTQKIENLRRVGVNWWKKDGDKVMSWPYTIDFVSHSQQYTPQSSLHVAFSFLPLILGIPPVHTEHAVSERLHDRVALHLLNLTICYS